MGWQLADGWLASRGQGALSGDWAASAARELAAIRRVVDVRGVRLLDVGCGDGRVTLALARAAAEVIGLDWDADELALARSDTPARLRHVRWIEGDARALPLAARSVDVVLWGWLFWNLPVAGMPVALGEALRVLRTPVGAGGIVDVRPPPGDPEVGVRAPDGREWHCGTLISNDDAVLARHHAAEALINGEVQAGRLHLAGVDRFDWVNVYASPDALVETVLESWVVRTINEATALALTQRFADAPVGSVAFIRQTVGVRLLQAGGVV